MATLCQQSDVTHKTSCGNCFPKPRALLEDPSSSTRQQATCLTPHAVSATKYHIFAIAKGKASRQYQRRLRGTPAKADIGPPATDLEHQGADKRRNEGSGCWAGPAACNLTVLALGLALSRAYDLFESSCTVCARHNPKAIPGSS